MGNTAVEVAAIDVVVVFVYLAFVIAHGFWVGRGGRDVADYFLAGRLLPWYLIGFSLYASNMSGASFVGLIGASYSHGMVVFNYEWTATLVLIFFAIFMLPVFLRAGLFTVPEYLEKRYDRRSRRAYSLFTILAIMFLDTAGALYAGGLVITVVFPVLSLWQASAILALLAGLYTVFGGLRAVVITDTLQAVLMIIGSALIFFIGLNEVGGWNELLARLDASQINLIQSADDDFLPWPGLLGVVLLGFYYWTLNQYFVQRSLAARSLDDGRKGALLGGLLKLPNVFLMIAPGMIAILLFPDIGNPDLVFPTLAFDLLPVGLRGLILTALIAAIMSSLDSALNAAASLVTMDFVQPLRPRTSARALLVIGRLVTAAAMVIAAAYAPLIEEFGSLFQYFQSTLSYIVPPIVAVYLGGIFCKRITAQAAFSAIIGGVLIGVPLFVAKEVTGVWEALGLPAIHFTYMSIIMFALAILILTVVSLRTPAPTADAIAGLTFRRADLAAGTGAPRRRRADYRHLAAFLAILMLTAILYFW